MKQRFKVTKEEFAGVDAALRLGGTTYKDFPSLVTLEGEPVYESVVEHIHNETVKTFQGKEYCENCVKPHPQPICLPPCTIDHDSHPQLIEEIEWVCCCGTDKCRIKDKLNELIRAHNART